MHRFYVLNKIVWKECEMNSNLWLLMKNVINMIGFGGMNNVI